MKVEYATNKLARTCNTGRLLKSKYGAAAGKAAEKRIAQLRAAEFMEDLKFGPGKWEQLSGDRSGEWSAHLTPNWRLIVVPKGDDTAMVVNIEDYH